MRAKKYCIAFGCLNKNSDPSKSFFTLPRDMERRRTWLRVVGRQDLLEREDIKCSNYVVCCAHFEDSSIKIKKHLKENAVPTIQLPDLTEETSCTKARTTSSSAQIKGKDNKNILATTIKEETCVENQIETSQSTEKQTQTSKSLVDGTARKRRVFNVFWERNPRHGTVIETASTAPDPAAVCCVFGCRSSLRDNPDKSFFPFPTQPEQYLHWLKLINREDLADKLQTNIMEHRLCSDHFGGGDFHGHNLSEEALPHLKLPQRSESIVYGDCGETELEEVKIEPPDAAEEMEVEIFFEPEGPPTVKFSDPKIPAKTIPEHVNPMDIENIEIPVFQINKNLFDDKPSENDPLKAKERFFKNATISCIEHVSLPVVETAVEKVSVHVQTTKDLIDKMNVPMKKKYEEDIRKANKKLKLMEEESKNPYTDSKKFIASCDKFLDEKMSYIVKAHATLLDKHKGNRYSHNFKAFALNLYLCSPQSYKFVEQFFYLPSMSTIHRFQTPIRTGVNKNLITSLKVKVDQMSEKEKMCTVCFDYMDVNKNLYYDVTNDLLCGLHEIDQVLGTEPAQYAPMIMVRGLYSKWKQPVSFALVAEKKCYPELKEWLYKTIAMLFDIGLNVKAFTANLETEFLDFSDISVTEPYFEVNGRRIYQIFDVPFLFKSAREDFMKYDFHFGSKVAKWSHVLEVYDADKEQELRLMPKITEQHVRPVEETEKDVTLAIEVFSRAVAAAMNFHVIANMVDKKAKHTVEFIQTMNNLFDILNSQRLSSENEFKKAYRATDEQNQFLIKTLEYLRLLEIKDEDGNLIERKNFVTGLLITIKSLVTLMEELETENLKYILTKHLSKDCMEEYFNKVREQGGVNYARPTSIMFSRSFRKLFLMNLVSNTKKGGTEVDLQSTLAKISDYVKLDIDWKKEDEEQNISLSVGVKDYQELWPAPSNDFIAGYLLRKSLEKHECPDMIENLCRHYNMEVDGALLLQNFKEYDGKNLQKEMSLAPPANLVDFVERMDQIFKDCSEIRTFGFGRNIYSKMEAEVLEMPPCECFPMEFFKFLFIRLKIFHTVKSYNMNNRPTRRRRVKK